MCIDDNGKSWLLNRTVPNKKGYVLLPAVHYSRLYALFMVIMSNTFKTDLLR